MARSPSVLIVDQDPDVRFQVQQLLPETGFALSGQAGLGTEGVALATETRPEIVLCGLKEPAARVVQTIESIAHSLPETPIIVYSDSRDLETVRKAMLAGARDFLRAPFKAHELKRSLVATLEAEERRRLREGDSPMLGPRAAVLTVYGAKGGVGKTTLAVNLAVAFSRQAGQRTVLVDADDTFGDIASALGLSPDRTVADVLREENQLDAARLNGFLTQHESGLAVLSGPPNPFDWPAGPGERLQHLLEQVSRQFDTVVVDTASTLSEVTQSVLEAASLVLWVTTPEYASVRDSIRALEAFRSLRLPEDRVRVVLNAAMSEVEVLPSSIEEALGRQIFWTVPYDAQLRRNAQLGQSLLDTDPNSPAARSLSDLARALSGMQPVEPEQRGSLLRRLFADRGPGRVKRERLEEVEGANV